MDIKSNLETKLYKWLDACDEVENDISSLVTGHNITKSKISTDISSMKYRLKQLEDTLKIYK